MFEFINDLGRLLARPRERQRELDELRRREVEAQAKIVAVGCECRAMGIPKGWYCGKPECPEVQEAESQLRRGLKEILRLQENPDAEHH